MDWANQTALVTGAGGFIGSHLVERLISLGTRTKAFVHYNSSGSWGWLDSSPVRDHVEVVLGDVMDRDSIKPALQGVDVVFHLAALIAIPYSYTAPLSYLRSNAEGTLNVLQACVDTGIGSVVHTSTSEVYGTAQSVPMTEDHPLRGQSPYSASKIGADKLAEAFHLSFGLPVATLRPFNTYGPRQSSRAVIPSIITQVLTGQVIRLGNLEPTRDFNFVADTVEGFIRIAECPEAVGEVIHIGSGREISIGDLADKIKGLIGLDLPIIAEDQRFRVEKSEVDRLCADNRKAETLLGWKPQYEFSDGLLKTIEWLEQNLESYRPDVYTV